MKFEIDTQSSFQKENFFHVLDRSIDIKVMQQTHVDLLSNDDALWSTSDL